MSEVVIKSSPNRDSWVPMGKYRAASSGMPRFHLSASRFIVWIAYILVSIHLLVMNRDGLLDQINYIEYFSESTFDNWSHIFFVNSWIDLAILFSEEIGWRLYTWLVSLIFNPEQAVYFTVLLINSLIFAAILRTRNPLFAYLLWMIIPAGLAVIGLFQIRQGLAFAVFLYGLTTRRPLVFASLSATLHTTLALPFFILIIKSAFDRSKKWYLEIALVMCALFGLSLIGAEFFDRFGGRRLDTYQIDEGASSVFFAVGNGLLAVWYMLGYIRSKNENHRFAAGAAFAGFGIAFFVTLSFFVFPLGTARVGYFSFLLAIPLLAEWEKKDLVKARFYNGMTAFVLLFIVYQAVKEVAAGGYDGLIYGQHF